MTYTREEMAGNADGLEATGLLVAAAMIRQLLAENDALRALTEWQDIADAPRGGKEEGRNDL